jgi:hypothetical protein
VTFRDPTNSASVEIVDPNDLPATFGPNVILAGATIEVTRDPVTTVIKDRLPWIDPWRTYIKSPGPNKRTNDFQQLDFVGVG